MKAIKATLTTSQPIATQKELETIFYKIPELYELHKNFLDALVKHSKKWDTRIGVVFKNMVILNSLHYILIANKSHFV